MPQVTKHSSYQFDMPEYGTRIDMDQLKDYVTRSGSHFFDADTMRFFRSRPDWHVYPGPDGWYFVTSEKHVSHFAHINEPRKYTVRRLSFVERTSPDGPYTDLILYELEQFQAYRTLTTARNRAKHYASTGSALCPQCSLRLMLDTQTTGCTECLEREERRRA